MDTKLEMQKVLPVISDWKTFEKFLKKSDITWCVLMDFHINFMQDLIDQLHALGKKAIVHMDLVKGLQNDQFGTQYMCQKLHVDGIISTKPKAIEAAKQNHCVSILRVFMIDSRSLRRGGQLAETLQPDFVEVLPSVIPDAVERMHACCKIPVIGGGLIHNQYDIDQCIRQGMVAVTTSSLTLCEEALS